MQAKAWKQVRCIAVNSSKSVCCQISLVAQRLCKIYVADTISAAQVVEGLGIKEGDLLEFELTPERALRVTVMKSSTVTRKPKKLGMPEMQASLAKKKGGYNRGGLSNEIARTMMLTGHEGVAMNDLLLPAAAVAAAQGLPIRLPDVNATQVCLSSCFLHVCSSRLCSGASIVITED